MRYRFTIEGYDSILMHCVFRGLNMELPEQKEKVEITKKQARTRTEEEDRRLRELECQISLWLDDYGEVTIPTRVIRASIENAARKFKEGPAVREGLIIESTRFTYDKERYGTTLEELGKSTQYTVPISVQKNRVLRTRARFEDWGCIFVVDADDEVVDRDDIVRWLKMAGKRMGIGDWRPQKSGQFGRFQVADVETYAGNNEWVSVFDEVQPILDR